MGTRRSTTAHVDVVVRVNPVASEIREHLVGVMLDEVPDPVWKTSIGNWSSNSPAATRTPATAIRSAMSESAGQGAAFARADAALIRPSQRATETGIGSPDTGKFSIALLVSPPHSSRRSVVVMGASLAASSSDNGCESG